MIYALIQDGAVVNRIELDDPEKYSPGAGLTLVADSDGLSQIGGTWDGEQFTSPIEEPVDLPAYAASKRFEVETGGISFGGSTIATDRESQAMISGAFAYVQQSPEATIQWKSENGFVELDAASMTAIALAVGAHVQACFAKEAEVAAAIEAETITDTAGIDAAFAELTA